MEYLIYRKNPLSQFIHIDLQINCSQGEEVHLQLPSWRPGRYEITNYAQKIRAFSVQFQETLLPFSKSTKDLWRFKAPQAGTYTIHYQFHAAQMDAGGSWSDDEQLYLNFINFCFELKGRENESIRVTLDLPRNYQAATALPHLAKNRFQAENFQHLVDSPVIASPKLKHHSYTLGETTFHLWFQGEIHFDIKEVLEKFKAFSQKQLEAFGDFPAEDYHFLFQLLPYRHYHGVEHQFSTVITFGPADSLAEKKQLDELMGVSSHELYHFWNVCRIRPKELMPYDFSKETYFDTGVVAEGVTSYMGDIFLLQSGYFQLKDYLGILEKQMQKEFDSLGWRNQSITESSLDLWLDGYKPGIPDKKVSIYNRGALISLCLDLILLGQGSSLHTAMRDMWTRFGKTGKGYTLADYEECIQAVSNAPGDIHDFFEKYIRGKEDLLPLLIEQLLSINIRLISHPHPRSLTKKWGVQLQEDGTISQIHSTSPAYEQLMLGDRILEVAGKSFQPDLPAPPSGNLIKIHRYGRKIEVNISSGKKDFYPRYELIPGKGNAKREKWRRAN